MSSSSHAFNEFMKGLELTAAERDKASGQQNELRTRLSEQLGGVLRHVPVGSYARGTAIRPLNDIDLFFVLDPAVHGGRHSREPQLLLEDVQRALRKCYPPPPNSGSSPSPETRIQGRSVNIEFTGTGIGYDVIPAFHVHASDTLDENIYEIPNRSRQDWIKTNPEVHKQHCIKANDRANGMLNRLIKAAKHWNHGHRDASGHKPLRSFHLEVMAYGVFSSKPEDERRGLRDLFDGLRSRVDKPCPDPAGLGPDVGEDLRKDQDQLKRVQDLLREATSLAHTAIQHEERGDHASACESWRSLLGPEFRF